MAIEIRPFGESVLKRSYRIWHTYEELRKQILEMFRVDESILFPHGSDRIYPFQSPGPEKPRL